VWNPSVHGAVGTWLGASAYRVMVRDQPLPVERMRTGMLAQMLVGSELLAGLDGEVLSEMFGAINPVMQPQGVESLLHKVVRQAVNVADEADRKAQRGVFAPVSYTVPTAVQVAAELQPVVAPAPTPAHAPAASSAAAASGPTPATTEPPAPESAGAGGKSATAEPADSPVEASQPAPAESAPQPVQPPSEPAPSASTANQWSLHAAVGIAPGREAASEAPVQKPIDPTAMRLTPRAAAAYEKAAAPTGFDDVLKGMPNSVREFFTALREDVASGAAKGVEWNEKGLVVAKRLIGSYGLASSTLVEHMRKRSLMVADASTEITLAPRAGQLILDRQA
jgi:conjugal transfer pilus assembly protein TraI